MVRTRGQVVTFETMAQDVLQDGGQVDELLGRVIDGLGRGLLQQSLHREPEERCCLASEMYDITPSGSGAALSNPGQTPS